MKIKLISIVDDNRNYTDYGLQSIVSFLKRAKYNVETLFIPTRTNKGLNRTRLNRIKNFVSGSQLIGLSCMTYRASIAKQVSCYLKDLKAPIVWGGTHATMDPEDCIRVADIICIGEGEEAILELVTKMDEGKYYLDTKNFWFKTPIGQIIKNDIRPYIEDLDSLPFIDYDFNTQYILKDDRLIQMEQKYLKNYVYVLTMRGCYFSCSFCCQSYLNTIYLGKGKRIRYRSISNVMEELKILKSKFPTLRFIWFTDNNFFFRPLDELRRFSDDYRRHIALPFRVNTDPVTIDIEKLKAVVNMGWCILHTGLETGSDRVNSKIYERVMFRDNILKASQLYKIFGRLKLFRKVFHVLVANPYETKDDIIQTIKLLQDITKPYILWIFSLIIFPATRLYIIVKEEKEFGKYLDDAYKFDITDTPQLIRIRKKNLYLNSVLYWMQGNASNFRYGLTPSFLLNFLISEKIISFVERTKIMLPLIIGLNSIVGRFRRNRY